VETDPDAQSFYRSLTSGVVVRCAGVYDDAEESPDPVAEDPDRPVGRVVIELPDFLAASLARMIESVWVFADRLTDGPSLVHAPDREVADALRAAALSQPGNRCGSLNHERKQEVSADPIAEPPWPPPWFGAARSERPDSAARSEELPAEGFGQPTDHLSGRELTS
jgi:hypothetical protein